MINQLQMQFDKRFGDIAQEKGLLTAEQIDALLAKQGNPYMQFTQSLTECTELTATVIDKTLAAFQKEHGFSDADMTALKADDLDALIPVFACAANPLITELAGLVVRNINRFVSRDFYIGDPACKVSAIQCTCRSEADRQYKSLSRTRRGVFRSGIFSDRRQFLRCCSK